MTTCDADNVSGRTALPGTDAVLVVPHILIAGDHAALQELLCSALQLAGYRTTACAGRQATLAWIDRVTPSGDCPALILLDLSTPCASDAADFLYYLRARWNDACGMLPQIIVLATYKKVKEGLMPMEHVVLKPFRVQDLIALIQRVISCAPRSENYSSSGECPSDQ